MPGFGDVLDSGLSDGQPAGSLAAIIPTCGSAAVMLVAKRSRRAALVYDVASSGGATTAASRPNPKSTDL